MVLTLPMMASCGFELPHLEAPRKKLFSSQGWKLCQAGSHCLWTSGARLEGKPLCSFASQELAEKALRKHKERIRCRYAEVFKSSQEEVGSYSDPPVKFMSIQRPRPQDRPGTARRCIGIIKQAGPEGMRSGDYSAGYGGSEDNGSLSDGYSLPLMCLRETSAIVPQARMTTGMETGSSLSGVALDSVHMRGLPYTPTENDTYNFSPLNPVRVHIETRPDGSVTGGADVESATHEKAVAAMSKDQANTQHRHIDLFLNSTPGASNGAYSSQMMQGMGVSAQPTYSGLESQSVSGCYGAGY